MQTNHLWYKSMLSTILSLFGRSPFAPLQSHMEKVACCVYMLPELFNALSNKDYKRVNEIADKISKLEHEADLTKNDIRNHLPKTLFLAIDRGHLLEILALQDHIADTAEDIAVLVTLKPLEFYPEVKADFQQFLDKNIEAYNSTQQIIKEMHELLESSFGGIEAQKVESMIADVAYKEHEADLIQRKLLKGLIKIESDMPYSSFYLWLKIFEAIAAIANLSENLANRIRMTLELKQR